ncbi:MFS transporter [Pandoraea sp.]|uniref:MFS transporter n=1 Tax=Pandoraea sp. TaxID=1883445 RepID=UPI00120C855C|nr:MFS transporter [Pandoraea sp.]TAL52301.1 MAG: MFS transporter [Pandoraea sp.]TAM16111.1 MAG: MFS transporter [Pandoraea sp.]
MNESHWQRNLAVCFFGAFINIIAMTLVLPFLPVYIEQLGVHGHAAIVQWSGIVYGATFLAGALVAPLWGRLADRFGCKPNLIRASIGMMLTMALIGLAQNVWQLAGIRLLVGLAGGYTSGSYVLVAAQTPKHRSAWALGVLSTGIMAGNLMGPLLGGIMPSLFGIRMTFFVASGFISLNCLATCILIREDRPPRSQAERGTRAAVRGAPAPLGNRKMVLSMLATATLLMVANMSIEPIITVYVQQLVSDIKTVTFVSGLAMSAAALGSIVSASRLGKLADRIGGMKVVTGCLAVSGLLLIPQAFVTAAWQLIGLRFLMGLSLGGLLPCVTALIRHNVPDESVGRVLGYSTSSQYVGQVAGPLFGGFVGGHIGMRYVFLATCVLLLACAAGNALLTPARRQRMPADQAR